MKTFNQRKHQIAAIRMTQAKRPVEQKHINNSKMNLSKNRRLCLEMKRTKRYFSFPFIGKSEINSTTTQSRRSSLNRSNQKQIKRITVRVLVLGGKGVGKTSLIKQLLGERFDECYVPTVHEEYEKEILSDDLMIRFIFRDTAGIQDYTAMREHYIQQSDMFFLVFASQDRESFELVHKLRKEIEGVKKRHSTELSLLVVQNKIDNRSSNEHVYTTSNKRIKDDKSILKWSYSYIKTSAKTGFNIHSVMEYLLSETDFLFKDIESSATEDEPSGRYLYREETENCVEKAFMHLLTI